MPLGSHSFCPSADEFNRVIIPVKRGEENTDYVNASFIDVSGGCVPRAPHPPWKSGWALQCHPPSAWEDCAFVSHEM